MAQCYTPWSSVVAEDGGRVVFVGVTAYLMCENVDDGGLRRSEPTPEVEELEQIVEGRRKRCPPQTYCPADGT